LRKPTKKNAEYGATSQKAGTCGFAGPLYLGFGRGGRDRYAAAHELLEAIRWPADSVNVIGGGP